MLKKKKKIIFDLNSLVQMIITKSLNFCIHIQFNHLYNKFFLMRNEKNIYLKHNSSTYEKWLGNYQFFF